MSLPGNCREGDSGLHFFPVDLLHSRVTCPTGCRMPASGLILLPTSPPGILPFLPPVSNALLLPHISSPFSTIDFSRDFTVSTICPIPTGGGQTPRLEGIRAGLGTSERHRGGLRGGAVGAWPQQTAALSPLDREAADAWLV